MYFSHIIAFNYEKVEGNEDKYNRASKFYLKKPKKAIFVYIQALSCTDKCIDFLHLFVIPDCKTFLRELHPFRSWLGSRTFL